MNCPVCSHPMNKALRREVEITICPVCKGVWLERGVIEKIFAVAAQPKTDCLNEETCFAPTRQNPAGRVAIYRYEKDGDDAHGGGLFG